MCVVVGWAGVHFTRACAGNRQSDDALGDACLSLSSLDDACLSPPKRGVSVSRGARCFEFQIHTALLSASDFPLSVSFEWK